MEYSNDAVKTKNLVFAILTLLSQVALGLVYGFQIFPTEQGAVPTTMLPIFMTFAYAMFTVVGNCFLIQDWDCLRLT